MSDKPSPTKRFVVDVGRKCNISCHFCYYAHLGDLRKQTFHSREKLIQEIDGGIARGNNYYDFTGGEPMIHPDICSLIEHGLSKGVKSCIITNALSGPNSVKRVMDSGLDDFLI